MQPCARDFTDLSAAARGMASDNARGYLSDALLCLRETSEPVAALELLRAMWNSGYANRKSPQAIALRKVAQWLEGRLGREPGIGVDRLLWELGWLRRMCTYHPKDPEQASNGTGRKGAQEPDAPPFGKYLEHLRQRRQQALAREARRAAEEEKQRIESQVPTALPDDLEVRLVSLGKARAAWNKARERKKKGKLPKDQLVSIQPVDARLQSLARDIFCSLLGTEGMAKLFERTAAQGGKDPSFRVAVADLVERDGRRIAPRLWFTDN